MGGAISSPTQPVISRCLPSLTAFLTFSLKAWILSFWSWAVISFSLRSNSRTYPAMSAAEALSIPRVLACHWSASPGSMPRVPIHLILVLVLTAWSQTHLGVRGIVLMA